GSMIMLNKAWYQNYPKAPFHTYNDAGEWQQVDKVGHAWSAYNLSLASTAAWNWAYGRDPGQRKKAILLGSLSGFTYLTVIEVLDAHSANWGWSWADMAANTFGTSLFAAQQLAWDEQKIRFKFSAHIKKYESSLAPRTNELFGSSKPEKLLKDYNGQTYWLSTNLKNIFPSSRVPAWLSVAIGYGAEGMYGGYDNIVYDEQGQIVFDRRDIKRVRQWYLAPDIDFNKIPVKKKWLRTVFTVLNSVKFPAPGLEFSGGKIRVRGLVF
ncbi:MAG: DUF2279 domain-containing protein, partial [Chitinophagaceae bacterium]